MTLDSSGNLGLGVTPSAWGSYKAIQVNSLGISGSTGDGGISFNGYYDGSNWKYIGTGQATLYNQYQGQHRFFTSASGSAGGTISLSQAMTLDASGNLGVGTSSPSPYTAGSRVVHIDGGANAAELKLTNNTSGASGATGAIFQMTGNDLYIWNAENSFLSLGANNIERARITSGGDFRVKGAGTAGSTDAFQISGSAPADAARLTSDGDFLIGTTSELQAANSRLNVAGDFYNGNGLSLETTNGGSGSQFVGFLNESGTLIGSINRNTTTNAVLYNTTSDERLKSNIQDAAPVLEKLMQVQVRQYDWIEGNVHQDYGFIAQEIAPVLSGVVTKGRSDDDLWQLDYSKLTPHLIKAIQEQQAMINELKAEVAALKGA